MICIEQCVVVDKEKLQLYLYRLKTIFFKKQAVFLLSH